MKKNIHPKLNFIDIKCSCGNFFSLYLSIENKNLFVDVCNKCHPFYTGQQKIIDVSKRVDNFNKKFAKINK